ncbi:hypothetical protein [Hydrogenophaga sp.]|uniref:hypothetical protein n=1 Tax=Hydrogenophaga sp. TaxID=1904254 RepID=UPI002762E30B|nr:hypothetical protein [Hydrogenophaga sp.]MDP2417613.1 hypothetical protein [Hydrogenophaga sp.]
MKDMSAKFHFSIKYDGPALASHQMDVRELAPALIALSELLEHANKAAYPDANEVRVNVQGNFKGGSFGVDLIAVQTVAQQIVSLLNGDDATAASNLLGILGGLGLIGGGGVIGLIKWLRGRKPSTIRTVGGKVVFELLDAEQKETFEVDLIAGKLYQTRVVRQTLARVVKPLEREGVDVFACGKDGTTQSVVTSDERVWFDMAASEADVVSNTVRQHVLLQIESAVFKDDNKWRFHDGSNAFFAEIADRAFVDRINAGDERFGKGDVLIADLRIIQSVTDSGLKQEYLIEKVHAHRDPLQQKLT